MLIRPRPSESVRIISDSSSAGSPKSCVPPWFSSTSSCALDRTDRAGRDIAVAQRKFRGVLADPDQQRLQVLQVQKRQPLFVGDPEGDVQHALLRVAEIHQARQQQWPHLGDRGANRMALFCRRDPRR